MTLYLPYNHIWFGPAPKGSGFTPTVGELHPLLIKHSHADANVSTNFVVRTSRIVGSNARRNLLFTG